MEFITAQQALEQTLAITQSKEYKERHAKYEQDELDSIMKGVKYAIAGGYCSYPINSPSDNIKAKLIESGYSFSDSTIHCGSTSRIVKDGCISWYPKQCDK